MAGTASRELVAMPSNSARCVLRPMFGFVRSDAETTNSIRWHEAAQAKLWANSAGSALLSRTFEVLFSLPGVPVSTQGLRR